MRKDKMPSPSWNADIPTKNSSLSLIGVFFLTVFVGLGGYWSYTAPLESAVVASGSFIAPGANKVVQHLEGGIVEKILVKEGDTVKANDILLRLDRTKANGEYLRLKKRSLQLLALKARLKWELNLPDSLKITKDQRSFPKPTKGQWSAGTEGYNYYQMQTLELQAGIDNRTNQIIQLQKQKSTTKTQRKGLKTVRKHLEIGLKELKRQIKAQKVSVAKGLATRALLNRLLLKQSQDQVNLSQNISEHEQTKVTLSQLDAKIASVDLTNREERIKELRTTQDELADVQERLLQAKNIAERVFIRAPVDGVIVQLSLNTEGGVISPGQQIMEILPTLNQLQIQVYVSPTERDDLIKGQRATVQLSALDPRTTPMLEGKVTYISADLIKQNQDDPGTYSTRIDLIEEDRAIATSLKAMSGMPASVFIKTGSQTLWEYLTRPIWIIWDKGIKER